MSITSANSRLALSVADLFPSPVPIEQFAVDNAFQNEPITVGEAVIGVDGHTAGAFVFDTVKVKITLMADSISKNVFDTWYQFSRDLREVLPANMILAIPSTGEVYNFANGTLVKYHGVPSGKKRLQDVEYEIHFESVTKSQV